MVRALSQPPTRPGSSQGSARRPSTTGDQSQGRKSSQSNRQGSVSSQSSASELPTQHMPEILVDTSHDYQQRGPPRSPNISVPRENVNMDAGLAQFEVSPSTSGSAASFEVLTLPDFASLAIAESISTETNFKTEGATGADNNTNTHTGLPVFLDPGSSFTFSPPDKQPRKESSSSSSGYSSNTYGHPADANKLLAEVCKENKRLSQCLEESTRVLKMLELERISQIKNFQRVKESFSQAEGNQSRLQEEVGRMLFQLEEERKVTANLSKNLELERRKVESLEQKAKGNSSTRGSSKGERRRSSLLPDEVRENETRLAQSMELYRQRCDNLGTSLASCQAKLEDERYCGDLTTEVNKLRKLLAEEKKKVGGENARLGETHALFEQIYLDYNTTMESVKQAQHEKRMKSQQQSVLNNIAESNMRDNVDSMTARLMQAEEALTKERRDNQQAREALAQAALDLEALPLLQAQVEVYQSDFNAERLARERIAGEKADLEEQLRKAGIQKQTSMQVGGGGHGGGFEGHQPRGGGGGPMNQYGHGSRGAAFEGPRSNGLDRGGGVRERLNSGAAREQQYDNIPRTVNIRPDPQPETEEKPAEAFTCPKCNREFRNTTLLTRHVNDCLDRDF